MNAESTIAVGSANGDNIIDREQKRSHVRASKLCDVKEQASSGRTTKFVRLPSCRIER